jgi:type IV secretory pathway VirB2 component (pilin)
MKLFRAMFIKFFLPLLSLLLPFSVWADNGIYASDPWDRALYAVLELMTGPTATTVGAIALVGTGYLFLRGRIDIMRLFAIIAGLALIFGAPHLVSIIQQQAQ